MAGAALWNLGTSLDSLDISSLVTIYSLYRSLGFSDEETLTAGKAIVAIPFFGDQPENARLMQEYGCAELIGRIPTGNEGSQNPYLEGWITADTVYEAVGKACVSGPMLTSSP